MIILQKCTGRNRVVPIFVFIQFVVYTSTRAWNVTCERVRACFCTPVKKWTGICNTSFVDLILCYN